MDKKSSFMDSFNKLSEEDKDKLLALLEILSESKDEQNTKILKEKNKFNKVWKKSILIFLTCLTILLTAVFGAFALSGDFRHAVIEVFEEKSDSTRVSSVFAVGGTAHTAVFIDHIAINQVRRAQGDGRYA